MNIYFLLVDTDNSVVLAGGRGSKGSRAEAGERGRNGDSVIVSAIKIKKNKEYLKKQK